ncbi:MAG: GTP 3',8-cyclase MoaA [Bacteroidia bacterium]|nr:GTP 3',8-cyclase MoaA [Bacteroidia bacterium]
MLLDQYQRVHDYLRISLTDNCNLRCSYCMPADKNDFTPPGRLMQADEIIGIAKIFVQHGVKKIRLTGGEPLVRKDAKDIILSLSRLPVVLALSTNGILVDKYLDVFNEAGITSINISLDTLDLIKFSQITHRNYFEKVLSNIHLLLDNSFHVKLNMVVMRGVNDSELIDFVELTRKHQLHIRFIEYMPFSGNQWNTAKVFSHNEILSVLENHYDCIKLKDEKNDTSKKFKVIGHQGTFALISTMTQPFCSSCNRLRLTADGRMKNCLFSKGEMDLLSAYRKGEAIDDLIRMNVWTKEATRGGQIVELTDTIDPDQIVNRSMVSIGG